MYGKVFASLWSGSMYAKTDAQLVFIYMLCNCDRLGVLDVTHEAIAGPVGMSVERVMEAVRYLESPDSRSRTDCQDGRRIVRLDAHRDWGWEIVNYKHYRNLRDEEQRREANRDRMRESRARLAHNGTHVRTNVHSAQCAPPCAHAEADAEEKATPGLHVATLREGAPFGRAISIEISTNLKASSPETTTEHAGAGNGAWDSTDHAAGDWGVSAGPCDQPRESPATPGAQNAQGGPEDRAGSHCGLALDSEGASTSRRDPGANAGARDYIKTVREIARPHGGALVAKTLALCGRLYNHGKRDVGFLEQVARHYVARWRSIQEPFAYYLGESRGSEGLRLGLAASAAVAEHQRHRRETAESLGESPAPSTGSAPPSSTRSAR